MDYITATRVQKGDAAATSVGLGTRRRKVQGLYPSDNYNVCCIYVIIPRYQKGTCKDIRTCKCSHWGCYHKVYEPPKHKIVDSCSS